MTVTPAPSPQKAPAPADETLSRAIAALRHLAAERPLADIRHGDIARLCGLPWQTVRSVLGPQGDLSRWLAPDTAPPRDTRSRILDAAARCFALGGYTATSLEQVGSTAGLTKGAVYWHFASKHDLFFALLDRKCQEMDQVVATRILEPAIQTQARHDPPGALKALLQDIMGHLLTDGDWPRLFIEFLSQTRDPEIRTRLGERYQASYASSAALIRAGFPLGKPPAGKPEDLAIFWTALFDGLLLAWLINPTHIDPQALMDRLVPLLWQGLGMPSSPSSSSSPAP